MTDKPILFSGPMVRAILDGRKTQTRRVLKVQPPWRPYGTDEVIYFPGRGYRCSDVIYKDRVYERMPYQPGDRLWMRETVQATELISGADGVLYLADDQWIGIDNTREAGDDWVVLHGYRGGRGKAVPAIHMPRWASRLTLYVTDVRVQRLQEISEEDAQAEGFEHGQLDDGFGPRDLGDGFTIESPGIFASAAGMFIIGWDEINAKRPGCTWEDNPWVCAVTFEPRQGNIDSLPLERAA